MRVKYDFNTKIVFQLVDRDQADASVPTVLHNAMYEYGNINAVSLMVDLKLNELDGFIKGVRNIREVDGFDIGIPFKSAIISYLDECDPASRAFKCVNYVKIREDGTMYGKGLDGIGMGLSIERATGSVKGKRILILGGGAVAGLIPAYLCEHGAAFVAVANRTVEKAKYIAETLAALYGVQTEYGPLETEYLSKVAAGIDIVVQCTSLGGSGHKCGDYEDLSFVEKLPAHCVAADVLYPSTSFLREAEAHGLQTINGQPMLYEQQLAMMELRFGVTLPEAALAYGEEAVASATALRDLRHRREGK